MLVYISSIFLNSTIVTREYQVPTIPLSISMGMLGNTVAIGSNQKLFRIPRTPGYTPFFIIKLDYLPPGIAYQYSLGDNLVSTK